MEINVLSLFDGISGCQQALDRNGIKVGTYYASEIDKYAITATMHNYPDTIQLGSVVDVDVSKLKPIDLLAGGSPCQSFTFAGKRKGMSTKDNIEILTLEHYLELKSQNFEFEGQSYLFWEYMRVLTDIRKYNPDVKFLLENVMMGEKWQKILTQAIGINPIEINSALVSAQNRRRLYWTNIGAEQDGLFGDLVCKIPQPKDKGILLKDVLESEVDEKYYLSDFVTGRFKEQARGSNVIGTTAPDFRTIGQRDEVYGLEGKMGCLNATDYKQPKQIQTIFHNTMPRSSKTGKGGTGPLSWTDGKTYCLDTGQTNAVEIVAMRGRGEKGNIEQQLEANGTDKSNSLTTVQKDNLVMSTPQILSYTRDAKGKVTSRHLKDSANTLHTGTGGGGNTDQFVVFNNKRLNSTIETHGKNIVDGTMLDSYNNSIHQDKSITVSTRIKDSNCTHVYKQSRIRRLTPVECCRLQTVKDNYFKDSEGKNIISESQQYKGLGNGWTTDVICHIFNYLK